MKKLLIILTAVVFAAPMFAQDAAPEAAPKDWKWSGVVGLNASATGMVNWSAGGKNNVAGTAFGKVRLLYEKDALMWDTNLDLEYGMTYIDQEYDKFQKSSDHIKLNSKFGWAFKPKWYLTISAGFQSQFALGKTYTGNETTNPIISNFLAPSYTDVSVGIDWKPNSIFSLYLSPIAGRITTAYISDGLEKEWSDCPLYAEVEPGVYSLRQTLQETYGCYKYVDDPDLDPQGGLYKDYRNAKAELGLTFKGGINWSYKDLKIVTNLTLFTPYAWDRTRLYKYGEVIYTEAMMDERGYDYELAEYMGYRDNNRRFGNFDVDWDVLVSYQFLKCLNVTLSTNLKYVNGLNIANSKGHACERVQFLANLGIGVGYAF